MAISNARRYLKYGRNAKAVRKQLVPIMFLGHKVYVHKKVAPIYKAWDKDIRDYERRHGLKPYRPHTVESFCWREIRGSKHHTPSMHSWAIAIDIDSSRNPMGQRKTTIPKYVRALAKKHRLVWGGIWRRPDSMHFEYQF
jgi:hypothetical protein